MTYNIYFELAAFAFLVVMNIYIRLQYNSDAPNNRRFKRLALIMLIAVGLDVLTAVTIDHHEAVAAPINMVLNFMYFSSDIVLEYFFVMYCMYSVYGCKKKKLVYGSQVVVLLSELLLVANFFTGWVYSFDKTGYVHGPLYFIVHAVPILAMIVSFVVLYMGFGKFNKNQRCSVVVYTIIAATGPVVQLMFPNVLFVLFAVALGFMMLSFSMETPDFQELMRTMDELRAARDEAEEAVTAAQKANESESQFLSTMSHELRTPINAIIGYSDNMLRETSDPDVMQDSGNILTAGKRLLSMVNDIMSYTEIQSARFSLEESNYSSASFLMDVISCGDYYTEKKNIEFRTDISGDIPVTLFGDSVRLTQVMDNLLSNAAKYTESGYVELSIGWRNMGDGVGEMSVRVTDTGIGMSEADASRISSSFLRLDKKRTQNIQGLGIGLTIVTRVLQFMDSRLEVSTEYGKGTSMSFKLTQKIADMTPVGKLGAKASDDTAKQGADFIAPNARLLAADDNMINLELVRRSLAATKAEIDTAMNGEEVLELVRKKKYDVIFLDHMMPVMDGMEAMKIIKRDNLAPGVPIIVVTANAISGEREAYLEAGFDDYASKPVTSSRLCDMLRKYLPQELVLPVEEEEGEPAAAAESALSKKLGFLNTEMGLAYCCNDEDFYLQIITTYIQDDKSELIRGALAENDIENYRITVHALKGTSRTIGADELSEEARKLEMAARENNLDYITANTERFLDEYRTLRHRIAEALTVDSDVS